MARLAEHEISERLSGVDEWRRDGDAISRELSFPDFTAAVAFVNAVAALAEAADHHPDIDLHGYNRVRLTLSTHSEGGLTAADFDLAARIDAL